MRNRAPAPAESAIHGAHPNCGPRAELLADGRADRGVLARYLVDVAGPSGDDDGDALFRRALPT